MRSNTENSIFYDPPNDQLCIMSPALPTYLYEPFIYFTSYNIGHEQKFCFIPFLSLFLNLDLVSVGIKIIIGNRGVIHRTVIKFALEEVVPFIYPVLFVLMADNDPVKYCNSGYIVNYGFIVVGKGFVGHAFTSNIRTDCLSWGKFDLVVGVI